MVRSRTAALILLLIPIALLIPPAAAASSQPAWQPVSSPTTRNLKSVFFLSSTNGWAIGELGTILHYDGSSWGIVSSPTTNDLQSVFLLNQTYGWAVGVGGTIIHWDGLAWSTIVSPTSSDLYSVFAFNSNRGGAMIVGANGTVLFWTGSFWSAYLPSPTANDLFSAYMFSPSDAYAVGDAGSFLHWNGSWNTLVNAASSKLLSVHFGAHVDGYAVGYGGSIVYDQDGQPLMVVSSPTGSNLDSVFMLSTTDGWAVGWNGIILHFDGSSWKAITSPPEAGSLKLQSVFMISPVEGWIVGATGIILHYATPDFHLASEPSISITQGASGTVNITVTSLNSFSGHVTLYVTGVIPPGVTFSISPNPVTLYPFSSVSTDLEINISPTAAVGTTPIAVTGIAGNLTHGTTFSLVILAATTARTTTGQSTTSIANSTTANTTSTSSVGQPDFWITSSASSMALLQGSSSSLTIILGEQNGFNSAVELSTTWIGAVPLGVEVTYATTLNPPASTPLVVTSTTSAATGRFTLRVTGTSGLLVHDVSPDIVVQINAPSTSTTTPSAPLCLIATATYGSELAPEVQLLRNFRDRSIMKTKAGSSFMVAFNAWYYSFSPYVAAYISTHWVERTIMKGVLYPLIGMLYITSNFYATTASYPELAALLSGLLASSLIGAFYLGIPLSLLRAKIRRLRGAGTESSICKLPGAGLLCGMAALLLGEILASPILLTLSSATIVLSTLFLSAAFTSAGIGRKLQT